MWKPSGCSLGCGSAPGSAACRLFMPRRSYKEFVWAKLFGEKHPGPAQDYSSFSPGICCPTARLLFLTLFNVLLHIMEGTTGTLERTLGFSRAYTVFVLEVKEHPQDRGSSWVALSVCFQGCFCFPVRTSSDWWIPSDCNAMPVNMH